MTLAFASPGIPDCSCRGAAAAATAATAWPPQSPHFPTLLLLLAPQLPKIWPAARLPGSPARWSAPLPKASLLQECWQLEAWPLLRCMWLARPISCKSADRACGLSNRQSSFSKQHCSPFSPTKCEIQSMHTMLLRYSFLDTARDVDDTSRALGIFT